MSFENQNTKVMPAGAFNQGSTNNSLKNMSGKGSTYPVPDIIAKKFNWGAFLLTWIWGIGNKTYITCVILAVLAIPLIGGIASLGFSIWFGIKGNEWAWQNKQFSSIQAFHENQKKWAIAGVIVTVIAILLYVFVFLATFQNMSKETSELQINSAKLRSVNELNEAVLMNKALGEKCKFSSQGLASCFHERMTNMEQDYNKLKNPRMGTTWTFEGNGKCRKFSDNCNVKIDIVSGKKSESITIPIYSDRENYVVIKEQDINQYMN